jgi:hypothetical protein
MYRVDRRQYNIGEIIEPPENSYQNNDSFNIDKEKLELILEEEKPNTITISRKNGLFIFPELSDAIRFSCIMTDSNIYKVEGTPDTSFFHKGDMNLTEVMRKINGNEKALRALAQSYWKSEKTFKPCWEVLIDKVQVSKIIIGDNESRRILCTDFKMKAHQNIEKLRFYAENLINE